MKSLGWRNFFYARLADAISLFHLGVVLVVAFGWWLVPGSVLHLVVLLLTLSSWVFTGSCILARAEYRVRKKYLQDISAYEHGYLLYHLRFLGRQAPRLNFVRTWGYLYLCSAIILWVVTQYVTTGMLS